MMRKTGNIWLFLAKTILFLTLLSVFVIGQHIFYKETLFYFWGNYVVLLLYAATLYFTCKIYHGFLFGSKDLPEIILSWVLCLVIANTLEYLQLSLLESKLLPLTGLVVILVVQSVLIIPLTFIVDKLYYLLNPAHNAIIIYTREEKARNYSKLLEQHRKKFKITAMLSTNETLKTLRHCILKAESVFFLDIDDELRETLLSFCFLHNKRTYILPTFSSVLLNSAETIWISNTPMFLPKSPVPDLGARIVKRFIDVVVSVIAIVLLSWLMLITWIVIRFYDHYPAIYKQTRITRGGKLFMLYKFRSMCIDAESDGVARLASMNDDRVTPIGRFIRKTRIDELPQFFNVLFGSMSLVGPRPERPEIAEFYEEVYPNFAFRTKVKAGITGFAQIYGRYNTEPQEKLFLDVMYIEKFSIWQDIKLILQTLKIVFMSSSTEGIEDTKTTALTTDAAVINRLERVKVDSVK